MPVSGNPLRIVVFGGIGSGKSSLTQLLGAHGARVIEADRIGHEVLRSTGPAFIAVSTRWPDVVVEGEIDRAALAAIVFADPDQLAELEAITHPLIAAEIDRRAAASGRDPVVVEVPLLDGVIGEGWTWVLVDAPPEVRSRRAVARGAAADDVAARMAAQPEEDAWHSRADWIVPNVGTLEDLAAAAAELWESLVAE